MHGIIATWRMAKEGIEQGFEQLNQNGKLLKISHTINL